MNSFIGICHPPAVAIDCKVIFILIVSFVLAGAVESWYFRSQSSSSCLQSLVFSDKVV